MPIVMAPRFTLMSKYVAGHPGAPSDPPARARTPNDRATSCASALAADSVASFGPPWSTLYGPARWTIVSRGVYDGLDVRRVARDA
jgi:hypothetical protein